MAKKLSQKFESKIKIFNFQIYSNIFNIMILKMNYLSVEIILHNILPINYCEFY